jgi:hypothetical protein
LECLIAVNGVVCFHVVGGEQGDSTRQLEREFHPPADTRAHVRLLSSHCPEGVNLAAQPSFRNTDLKM